MGRSEATISAFWPMSAITPNATGIATSRASPELEAAGAVITLDYDQIYSSVRLVATPRTRNDEVISGVGKRMKLLLTVVTLAILGTGFPIHAKAADNDDNASKCKNLALKAHPSSLPDIPAVTNLRHDYYTLCMARHGKMGVVNPGTATAAPRGHFDGGYVGPGIGVQVDRSPRPGDAGCLARGLVRTPVGLRSRFIYTC
jgi:hypothetical protein